MPRYHCDKCGRDVELPQGSYTCKVCGSNQPMRPVQVKHQWLIDIGSFYVEAYTREEAEQQAMQNIRSGDVNIDQIIDEGPVE